MVALTVVLDGLLHGDSSNDSDFKESPTLHLCSIKVFRCISCHHLQNVERLYAQTI